MKIKGIIILSLLIILLASMVVFGTNVSLGPYFDDTYFELSEYALILKVIPHEKGGLEADVSTYDGLLKISSGSTSAVKVKLDATQAPTVNNDVDEGYAVGSRWCDVTNDKEYICLDNTDGDAVWTETTQSGGGGTYLELTDTPAGYDNGKYAKSTADGVIWDDPAGAGDMLKATYDTDGDGDIDVAAGGTEKSSWTLYCIPYLSGTTAFGEIPIGTAEYALTVNAGANGYDWTLFDLSLYYLKTEIDTLSEVETIYTKNITDSTELASALGAYYLKTAIDTKAEMDTIWGVTILTDDVNTIDSDQYVDASIDHEHLAPDVISGMTDVTSADADYMLIWDATDSVLKKVDMGEVRGAGGASQLSDLSDVHTSTVTDKFVLVADGVDFESRALVEADVSNLGTAVALVADKLDVFAATTEAELYTVLSDVAQFYESGDKVGDADTLDTHDTSYFQIALTDEASLYSALSDVTQFYESGDKVGDADTLDTHDTSYFQTDLTDEASLYSALSDVTMFLEDTIDDTTPELGGEMDAGAHSIGFTVQTITSTAGTATIDWGDSNKARITLSENTTLAFTDPANSGSYMLIIIQPAGGNEYTTTFPAGIYWASGTKVSVPVTNGNRCIVSFAFDDEDSDKWYCQGTETFATDD